METILTAFMQLVLLIGVLAVCAWAVLLAFVAVGSIARAVAYLLHDAAGLLPTRHAGRATGAAGV